MNKVLPYTLIFFFITGLFAAAVSSISTPELIGDSWNTKMSTQPNRTGLGVVAVDGKIYAIGGSARSVGVVGSNECYDPVMDTWVTLEPMPTPREAFAIAVFEGKIYCMGGYNNDSHNMYLRESIFSLPTEVYDPVSNRWSIKTSAPFANGTWQSHAINGYIFVISANNIGMDDYKRDWYMYDPVADSWGIRTRTPVVGRDIASVVVDDKIIVFGTLPQGNSDSKDVKTKVMAYNPKTDGEEKISLDSLK
jgi:N-acetylneuraminic acid mutarotase